MSISFWGVLLKKDYRIPKLSRRDFLPPLCNGSPALRHPDKVRSCDPAEAKAAFARLDAAAKVVEALFDLRFMGFSHVLILHISFLSKCINFHWFLMTLMIERESEREKKNTMKNKYLQIDR